MREPESINANEDTRLVPVWSIMVAAAVFVLVEYYFWIAFPKTQHHIPPLGIRIYLNLSWGLVAALYFLMVGYISKDAPRRAMSSRFWMLVCFVMPGGIGAVLYFLLRAPLVSRCPACGTHCPERFPFLPAMQLPADRELRQLLQNRTRHGPVLHPVRSRVIARSDASAPESVGRIGDHLPTRERTHRRRIELRRVYIDPRGSLPTIDLQPA